MSPKVVFEKEDIINAAFDIAKEKGFEAITTRNVAKHLGCSVAPIYVNFDKVEELIDEVIKKVFAISDALIGQQSGKNSFEKVGKASIEFAQKYPVLFRELTFKPNRYMASYDTVEKSLLDVMAEDEKLSACSLEERRVLLFKMRVFQLGLAVMIANGHVPSWLNDSDTQNIMIETGEDLIEILNVKKERGES